jgi:hypothetical protein
MPPPALRPRVPSGFLSQTVVTLRIPQNRANLEFEPLGQTSGHNKI